jgi:hypothetical protein
VKHSSLPVIIASDKLTCAFASIEMNPFTFAATAREPGLKRPLAQHDTKADEVNGSSGDLIGCLYTTVHLRSWVYQ